MLNINRLLVPTDYSESAERALDHARFLAEWHDAELHVLHVVERQSVDENLLRGEDLLSEREMAEELNLELDHDTEALGSSKKVVTEKREASSARDAIVSYAEEKDVDLIVMGTRGRGAAGRLILGSTAEGVVRLAECPVLTVTKDAHESPRQSIESILVPVDFSSATEEAIAYAVELAQTYGSRIDLLHVVSSPRPLVEKYPAPSDIFDRLAEAAQERLAEIIRDEIGFEHVMATVKQGEVADEIMKYAQEQESDLIVIPTHGRTGLERLLLGSVTTKVVRAAKCPVLTIKPFGKSVLPKSKMKKKAR